MIYCGYQGCGKSTYCKKHPTTTIDLDSSSFYKIDGWEENYIKVANTLSRAGKKVFISAHQVVINKLIEKGIEFELLLPTQNKKIWKSRLELRYNINPTQGNKNALMDFEQNFDKDMAFYADLNVVKHYVTAVVVTDIDKYIGE